MDLDKYCSLVMYVETRFNESLILIYLLRFFEARESSFRVGTVGPLQKCDFLGAKHLVANSWELTYTI